MTEPPAPRPSQRALVQAMTGAARRRPQMTRIPATHRGDFTNVLVETWARVCRILAFYQERIAAEGYLDSAVEPFSVIALAGMAGETRVPAVSARTHLAVRVTDVAGQPDRLHLSRDHPIVVQNVPPAGQMPVVFEATDTVELRAAWNAMPVLPHRCADAPVLRPSSRSIRLAGTDSGARAGAALYLRAASADPPRSWLVTIAEVVVDRRRGCTIVTWVESLGAEPLGAEPASPTTKKEDWPYPVAEIVVLSRNAGLFGNAAAAWSDVPPATKAAIGVRAGGMLRHDDPPPDPAPEPDPDPKPSPDPEPDPAPPLWRAAAIDGDVQAIVATPDDVLYAVGSGAWRSDDHGASWRALTLPPGRCDLLAVAAAGTSLYAGDASGKVLQSNDGGTTWAVVPPLIAWTPIPGLGRDILGALHLAKPPAANTWLLAAAIRALVVTADVGDLFAGTDNGVLRRAANDLTWTPFNDGLPQINPASGAAAVKIAALVEFTVWLVAATDHGLFASPLERPGWFAVDTPTLPAGTQLHDLAANAVLVDGKAVATLFVASSAGIAATPDLNQWADFSVQTDQGNPGVRKIVATPSGVQAATAGGMTRSGPFEARWSPWAMQELDFFTADASLAPGLDTGLAGDDLVARFARFAIGLVPRSPVTVIDSGKLWEVPSPGEPDNPYRLFADDGVGVRVTRRVAIVPGDVRATAMTSRATVMAVAPGPVRNTEWPDFTTGGRDVLLDRRATGVEPPGQLALAPASQPIALNPAIRSVAGDETVAVRAFGKQATVTRVLLDGPDVPALDPRTTTAWFDSTPVAAYAPWVVTGPGVGGSRLTLGEGVLGIVPGRRLIVSGPRPLAAVLSPVAPCSDPVAQCLADIAPLLDQDVLPGALKDCLSAAGIKLSPDAALRVVVASSLWLLYDGDRAWRLDSAAGGIAIAAVELAELLGASTDTAKLWTVATPDGERQYADAAVHVVVVPATADMTVSAETVTVAVVVPTADGGWQVDVAPPLRRLYDSQLCRVSANVVTATQGEKVPLEILGTGDPSRANQVFPLHRGPLSYVRGADGTPRPALSLEVNGDTGRSLRFGAQPASIRGEAWTWTIGLACRAATDRVYELITDADGNTSVRFGDGRHGARLPSGDNNIAATYRVGAGRTGNVVANTLTALRKRIPGIRSVTNPLAATGGAEAESIEHLRARTRDRAAAIDRVVTVADHARRAMAYAGIRAAVAAMVERADDAPHVLLTVVAAEPSMAHHDWAGLRAWIDAVSPRRVPMSIVAARTVLVGVDLTIALVGNADAETVEQKVRERLVAAFGAAERPLGAQLDPADIAAVAKAVPGVQRVKVDRIRQPARVAAATLHAPDLIAIDPADIRIELQP